ncbi:MAG: hypothetical protein WCV72_02000 [Patescibacteria group bacterium]
MNKKNGQSKTLFGQNLEAFLDYLESLKEVLPAVMSIIRINHQISDKRLDDFIEKYGKNIKVAKKIKTFSIAPEDNQKFKSLKKPKELSEMAFKVIPRSLFNSLITQFDVFIRQAVRLILLEQTGILNSSEKQICFKELCDFNSIDEAKNFLIEKEIDGILRESHEEHFVWLEKKLGMVLRKDLDIWPIFVELTERRNLFTHCDGVVNPQYIRICAKHKFVFTSKPKIGDTLSIGPEYFYSSYDCLREIAVKLTHVVWRKLLPSENDIADDSLNELIYNLIRKGEYKIADRLLIFATEILKQHPSETTLNCLIMNKALSKLLGGDKDGARRIVENKDWSACSDDFKLGKEIILGNNKNVFELMEKIGQKGDLVTKIAYRDWPLFSQIKKSKKFQEIFKNIFKEEYMDKKEIKKKYHLKLEVV